METQVRKLYNDSASVRDYIVESCYQANEDLVIKYRGQKMTVPHNDLLHFMQFHRHTFQSKYKAEQTYQLIDFVWQPDQDPPPEPPQLELF
jgi:hypothetical protein|tara:strand:- start:14342 stop:14614 length:273 start_codon:yes stop_codon:yes gene_type:complete